MVIPKFKIGDEVETNEKYRKMAIGHNEFMKKITENHKPFPLYRKGKVTELHEEDFDSVIQDPKTGCMSVLPFLKATDIIVSLDGSEQSLNQNFLKLQESKKEENK